MNIKIKRTFLFVFFYGYNNTNLNTKTSSYYKFESKFKVCYQIGFQGGERSIYLKEVSKLVLSFSILLCLNTVSAFTAMDSGKNKNNKKHNIFDSLPQSKAKKATCLYKSINDQKP
ncbi:hypothetical protein V6Z11_D06G221400 [Gossypium hirsutum]